jgi:hypothetical protein
MMLCAESTTLLQLQQQQQQQQQHHRMHRTVCCVVICTVVSSVLCMVRFAVDRALFLEAREPQAGNVTGSDCPYSGCVVYSYCSACYQLCYYCVTSLLLTNEAELHEHGD